jgi:hypothetical protein
MTKTINDTNIVQILENEYINYNECVNENVEKLVMTEVLAMDYVNIIQSLFKIRSKNPNIMIPRVLSDIFDIELICKYDSVDWLQYYYNKYKERRTAHNDPQSLYNDCGHIQIKHYMLNELTNVACEYGAINCLQFLVNEGHYLTIVGATRCVINDFVQCLSIFLEQSFTMPKNIINIAVENNSMLCMQHLLIYGHNITLKILYDLIEADNVQYLQWLHDYGYRYSDYHLYHSILYEAENVEIYFASLNISVDNVTNMTYDMKKLSLNNDLFIN